MTSNQEFLMLVKRTFYPGGRKARRAAKRLHAMQAPRVRALVREHMRPREVAP